MELYRNILVAIDVSSEAEQILRKALDLAQKFQVSKVLILTVVEPVILESNYDLVPVLNVDIENDLVKRAETHIDRLMGQLNCLPCEKLITVGATKAEIHRVAQENASDLIVIGSHGRHGIARLLGSTASAVLHGSPCDVLTVKITE